MSSTSKTVADIMNPKLLYAQEGDRAVDARHQLLRFGVTTLPVLGVPLTSRCTTPEYSTRTKSALAHTGNASATAATSLLMTNLPV